MTNLTPVNYKIKDSNGYPGKIDTIRQMKSSAPWSHDFPITEIKIVIEYPSCIIKQIKLKNHFTPRITIVMFNTFDPNKTLYEFSYELYNPKNEKVKGDAAKQFNSELPSQITNTMEITLSNNTENEICLGLAHFLIEKQKDEPVAEVKKNLSTQQQFKSNKKQQPISVYSPINTFKNRQKSPKPNKDINEKNLKKPIQTLKEGVNELKKSEEQQTYERIIRESKQLYEQQQQMKVLMMEQDSNSTVIIPQQVPTKQYQRTKVNERQLRILENLNSRFRQSMIDAEIENGVNPEHRLSTLVPKRIFEDAYFCVAGFEGVEKERVIGEGKRLGLQYEHDFIENIFYLMVSNFKSTPKTVKALEFKNVRIVRREYFTDCLKLNARLDPHDYKF